MRASVNHRLARPAIVLLALNWALTASAADPKATGAPPEPVQLRWQADLAKPVNFLQHSYTGTEKRTDKKTADTDAIASGMKLAWEKIPEDIRPITAFEIYTFDRSGLEAEFVRNLEVCQGLGYRITFEVNRDEPDGASENCSVEWLDEMFKKYPCFVGVNYGVTANKKPEIPTDHFLKLPRVKALIEVCGKNGAYFMFGLWNESQTTRGVLDKMLADEELVSLMRRYHRNIIFFNSANIRTQIGDEEHVENGRRLRKMLDDGLIGRMGNYDFYGGKSYDHDWNARKAEGYRAFCAAHLPGYVAYWDFLRTFDPLKAPKATSAPPTSSPPAAPRPATPPTSAVPAADPGRPKIVNNTIHAADGQKPRGDTLFLTDTTRNNRGDEFTLTPQAWSENAQMGFNIRRLWASGGTEANNAAKLAKIDQCVDLAARAGQYVIIVYGPPSDGPIGSNHHKEFWRIVAARYKDRTHVVYELANEPPEAWPTNADETAAFTGGIPMAKMVRDLAPDAPIILFSNNQNPRAPAYYQKFQDGYQAKYGVAWSWANALVGFHGYYLASTAQMQAVKDRWPCINTETPTYYRGDGEKTAYGQSVYAIEDDWDQIVIMEKLGIAWINFDHCTRMPYGEPAPSPWYRGIFRDFHTGPFADYLAKKNVAWWVKGPAAAITSPENCATFTAPASVSLTASATDNDGTITKVEFYSGTAKLGETTAAPHSFIWNNVAVGAYSVTAKAVSHAGATHTSYPVKFTVLAPGLAKATIADSTAGAQQKGNTKERAYDGNINTRWANDGTLANAWIQYDLGSAQPVAAVKIRPYNGRTMTYPIKIEVGDGSVMATVWSGTTEWWEKTLQTFDVKDATGRYVKITMTGNNSHDNAWLGIYETEIYVTGTLTGSRTTPPSP